MLVAGRQHLVLLDEDEVREMDQDGATIARVAADLAPHKGMDDRLDYFVSLDGNDLITYARSLVDRRAITPHNATVPWADLNQYNFRFYACVRIREMVYAPLDTYADRHAGFLITEMDRLTTKIATLKSGGTPELAAEVNRIRDLYFTMAAPLLVDISRKSPELCEVLAHDDDILRTCLVIFERDLDLMRITFGSTRVAVELGIDTSNIRNDYLSDLQRSDSSRRVNAYSYIVMNARCRMQVASEIIGRRLSEQPVTMFEWAYHAMGSDNNNAALIDTMSNNHPIPTCLALIFAPDIGYTIVISDRDGKYVDVARGLYRPLHLVNTVLPEYTRARIFTPYPGLLGVSTEPAIFVNAGEPLYRLSSPINQHMVVSVGYAAFLTSRYAQSRLQELMPLLFVSAVVNNDYYVLQFLHWLPTQIPEIYLYRDSLAARYSGTLIQVAIDDDQTRMVEYLQAIVTNRWRNPNDLIRLLEETYTAMARLEPSTEIVHAANEEVTRATNMLNRLRTLIGLSLYNIALPELLTQGRDAANTAASAGPTVNRQLITSMYTTNGE